MNCRGCAESIMGEATILGDKVWHPKCLRIASSEGSEYTIEDMKRRIAHLEGRLDAQYGDPVKLKYTNRPSK